MTQEWEVQEGGLLAAWNLKELCEDLLHVEQPEATKIDPRLVQLAKETANLPTRRELAWAEIQRGVDPKWVAVKYLFPVEDMQRAKEAHEQREAEKKARTNRGNES